MKLPGRPERSNRVAGSVCLIGAAVAGIGGLFPWALLKGPDLSFNFWGFASFSPHTGASEGGIAGGGLVALGAGAVVALLALILYGTHRWRGLTWRTVLFLGGVFVLAAGGVLLYSISTALDRAVPDGKGFFHVVIHQGGVALVRSVEDIQPGIGAYAILIGGALITFGALIPGRRVMPTTVVLPSGYGQHAIPYQPGSPASWEAPSPEYRPSPGQY